MTIERLTQLGAELRVLSEIAETNGATWSISSAQAYTGTYSYLQSTLGNAGMLGVHVTAPVSAYRLGFWNRHDGIGGSIGTGVNVGLYRATNGLVDYESATIAIRVNNSTGNLEVVRPVELTSNSFEVLFSAPIPASLAAQNVWMHIGIAHKIDELAGFLSLYINGTRVLNYTGDTRLFGQNFGSNIYAATAASLYVGGGALITDVSGRFDNPNYVDDFYVDSYVGEVDSPVPARRFLMVLPTAAGADAAWTPDPIVANYLNVDENPNDGDATYNKALVANLRDTFAMGDITVPADHRIVAVIPSAFAKRLDSELAHQISFHAYDGLTYADSADVNMSMSYDVPVFARLTTQPDGSDWNETDFASMQFGYRSRGVF